MRTAITAALVSLSVGSQLSAQQSPVAPTWEITLGAGAVVTPSYAGAEEHQLFPFPLTQITYRSRIYLGQSATGNGIGLGAHIVRVGGLGVAAEVGFLQNRPSSRADALAGMEDRDFVGTANLSIGYAIAGFEIGISGTRGLNDDAGLLGSARLSYTQTIGSRFSATLGFGATVADARQMRWDFGVNDREAARRQALIEAGDDRLESDEGRAFRPEAGLRHTSTSLSLMFRLSSHWALVGFGGIDRLSHEANQSPLVRRREQASGGIGLGYRF